MWGSETLGFQGQRVGQNFIADPANWWDIRSKEESFWQRDGLCKVNDALWLSLHEPVSKYYQLNALVAETRTPAAYVPTSASGKEEADEGALEVQKCKQLCVCGQFAKVLDALNLLVQRGVHVHNNVFYRALKRCIAEKDLALGRRLHALIVDSGYEGDRFLTTHLVGLYASHGRLKEAMQVFFKVSVPDEYNWAAVIFACTQCGEPSKGIELYRQMLLSPVKPSSRAFTAVLKACGITRDLDAGKEVHAHVSETSGKPNLVVQTCLVDMYAKCGSLEDARKVFNQISQKDVVTWTVMIAGYAHQGLGQEALCLYSDMQQEGISPPDSVTFMCLLQACASAGSSALHMGKQLHNQIIEQRLQADVAVGTSLVNMYARCGSLENARRVFDKIPHKNVVTWNAMIAGYSHQGLYQEALGIYRCMQQAAITAPNSFTFACLLQACAGIGAGALHQGKKLHAELNGVGLQDDAVLGSTLVNMYAKCGSVEAAQEVFNRLSSKDVVTWTTMIAGYVHQGMGQKALRLYRGMCQHGIGPPSSVTFICLLQACAIVGRAALQHGEQLHVQIEDQRLHDDTDVSASLITMYSRVGCVDRARRVFDKVSQKDVVTWTAMIAGYAQQGRGQDAVKLYNAMLLESLTSPNAVTFVCLLQACASAALLPLGKQLHAHIELQGLLSGAGVGSGLVNMYAKCGSLEDAEQVFDALVVKDVVAWSALIAGYSRQGDSETVFELVDRMCCEGIPPNSITFLSVLTVCSHVGLVDKGRQCFEVMRTQYGIIPSSEHFACMIDLLARAGCLKEALQLVNDMACEPNGAVWVTLLGACQKWGNVKVGQQAFEFAVKIDDKDPAPYILMSNIYAGAQMWEEAKELQARRVKCGAWKQPGHSWLADTDGVDHTFEVEQMLSSLVV